MALNNIYVDPSIASDSGDGSIGTPYGDLEWALEQVTPDAGGDRFNIKAGTDEILAAELSIAIAAYGTPTEEAPLVFQGYTSVAEDGGVGGVSGGGLVSIVAGTSVVYTQFIDCHLHNTGAQLLIRLGNYCGLIRCEVDNSTNVGNAVWLSSTAPIVESCYVHNVAGIGILVAEGIVSFCYVENGVNECITALWAQGGATLTRNIAKVSGASNGMQANEKASVIGNSIWSDGGTGSGLLITGGSLISEVSNNLFEGFSGAGGKGVGMSPNTRGRIYGGNAAFNCETAFEPFVTYTLYDLGKPNEVLGASPFTDATNGDFNPVDTGTIKEGAVPQVFGTGQ